MSLRTSVPLHHPRYATLRRLNQELEQLLAAHPAVRGALAVDYGCGDGPYQTLLSARFERILGADLAPTSAPLVIDESGRVPLADGAADLVLSTQVLEHVPSPNAYLREAARLLAPTGTLLLSTHGFWPYHPHPTDYWRWTRAGLVREIEQAGLQVIDQRSVLGLASVAVQLWQDATVGRLPKILRAPYSATCQLAIGAVERAGTQRHSDNAAIYVMLARKPTG